MKKSIIAIVLMLVTLERAVLRAYTRILSSEAVRRGGGGILGGLTASGTCWEELVMLIDIPNFRLYYRQNVGFSAILRDGEENERWFWRPMKKPTPSVTKWLGDISRGSRSVSSSGRRVQAIDLTAKRFRDRFRRSSTSTIGPFHFLRYFTGTNRWIGF